MARTNNLTNFLTDVSAAIKQKIGDNTPIPAANFDTEILSIETAGTYQDKTLSITTNGNYRLEPDQNFDAMSSVSITVSVPTGEDLDAVITAQEQKLATLEQILQTKASGSAKPNIFVQLEEPTTKKGIWLQTDETAEHYACDDDVVESESWYPDGTFRNIPVSKEYCTCVSIASDIYYFSGVNEGGFTTYKYDTINNTYTQLSSISSYDLRQGMVVSCNNNIYLFSGVNWNSVNYAVQAHKYDILTNTYTRLTDIPVSFTGGSAISIGTDIYLFGGYSTTNVYKYDTITDTYTKLTNLPKSRAENPVAAIGTDIYVLGNNDNGNSYKYSTLTDTYTSIAAIPYRPYCSSAVAVGTDIYLFGSTNSGARTNTYKYNALTDTWTQLTNIPYNFGGGGACLVDNKIYLFGGNYYKTKVQCMQVVSKTFEDNSVVISQGRLYNVGYATELFSCGDFISPALYAFADAWFYTTQDGLDGSMPLYYGDGTNWINIKNPHSNTIPPQEEVEEED